MCVIVEGDIYNGGFSQFFWNSKDDYLDDGIAAYERFGMSEMADLMRDAKKFYRRERRVLERLQSQRSHEAYIEWTERPGILELERRFSELEPTIRPARVKYIRDNLHLFAES